MKKPDGGMTKEEFRRMTHGYWVSRVIFSGNELGIFDALAGGALPAARVASKLRLSARGTEILLDALTALGLLRKSRDGRYGLGAFAIGHLVSGADGYMGNILMHGSDMWESWGALNSAVKTGKPIPKRGAPGSPEAKKRVRNFILGMDDAGRDAASALAEKLDLSSARRVLDLGGGPGAYMREFVRQNPRMRATVFDLPLPIEIAKKLIRAHGLEHRIDTAAGDFLTDDFGKGYDLILLSSIVHIYSAAVNRRLIRRAAAALNPGGVLVVKDFALDPSRTTPAASALFSVNMLVNTDGGRAYSGAEIAGWLKKAGLKGVREERLAENSSVVTGRK
ncbi:MAG: methyltransferase [bacterium]